MGKKYEKDANNSKWILFLGEKKLKSSLEWCSRLTACSAQASTKYWYEEKDMKKKVVCVVQISTFNNNNIEKRSGNDKCQRGTITEIN